MTYVGKVGELVLLRTFCFVLSHYDMVSIKKQRICVKFCFKLQKKKKTAAETYRMLCQAYVDEVLSKMTT
jgi:hypothetical protein